MKLMLVSLWLSRRSIAQMSVEELSIQHVIQVGQRLEGPLLPVLPLGQNDQRTKSHVRELCLSL